MEVGFVQKLLDMQEHEYEEASKSIIEFEDVLGDIIKHTEQSIDNLRSYTEGVLGVANDFYRVTDKKNKEPFAVFMRSSNSLKSYADEVAARLSDSVVEPQLRLLSMCSRFKDRMKKRETLVADYTKLFQKLKKREDNGITYLDDTDQKYQAFENAYDELRLHTTELVIDLRSFFNIKQRILDNNLRDTVSMHMNLGDQMGRIAAEELPVILTGVADEFDDDAFEDLLDNVENVIKDDIGMRFFRLHLESEYSVENLYFYLHAMKYKEIAAPERKKRPSDELEIDARAREIYDLYIVPDSYNQINIDSTLVQLIADRVNQDEITYNMFDEALEEILELMGRDSFERFRHSDLRKLFEECYKRTKYSFWDFYIRNGEFEAEFPVDYQMLRFSDPILLPTVENPNPTKNSINEMERLKKKEWRNEERELIKQQIKEEKERMEKEKQRIKEEKERLKAEKKEEKEKLRKEREKSKDKDKDREKKDDKDKKDDRKKAAEPKGHLEITEMGGIRLLDNDDLISAHRSLRRVEIPPELRKLLPVKAAEKRKPGETHSGRTSSLSGPEHTPKRIVKKTVHRKVPVERRGSSSKIHPVASLKKPMSKAPSPKKRTSKTVLRRKSDSEALRSPRAGPPPSPPPSLSKKKVVYTR